MLECKICGTKFNAIIEDIILLVITERLVWQLPLALLPKKVYMTHLIARCAAVR